MNVISASEILIADEIVFAGQGVVDSAQVLGHARAGFFRIAIFLQIAAGRMDSGVEEVDPDSHLGAVELICAA